MSYPRNWPRVFTTKNLLGGEPDRNRRFVYTRDTGYDREVAIVMPDKDGWSRANQIELEDIVLAYEAAP